MTTSNRKKAYILVMSLAVIAIIAVSFRFFSTIEMILTRGLLKIFANIAIGIVALIALKASGMEIDFEPKNWKQFIIGGCIGFGAFLFFGLIPTIMGFEFLEDADFNVGYIFIAIPYYFIVVSPVEELAFSVYVHGVLVDSMEKNKWIGVILSALCFCLFKLIFTNLDEAMISFILGLIFGFVRYKMKNGRYLGIAFGHAMYDTLLLIFRYFI